MKYNQMADIRLMKYEVGDEVKIRTWESMEKEYGIDTLSGWLKCPGAYAIPPDKEKDINKDFPNRTLTIKKVFKDHYVMGKIDPTWNWTDYMIEGLAKNCKPIDNRFEILDL